MLRNGVSVALRPVWRRVWSRVELRLAPVERRLFSLEHQPVRVAVLPAADTDLVQGRDDRILRDHEAFRAELGRRDAEQQRLALRLDAFDAAWRQHLPALLDVATRARDFADRVQSTLHRVEGLEGRQRRQQAQLDMVVAALAGLPAGAAGPDAPGRAVATRPAGGGASRSSEGSTRLSFCGPAAAPREGYVNISLTRRDGFDFVSAGLELPFAPGSITEIVAHGFLEGMEERALRDEVLPAWRELLRPGARMRLVALDLEAAVEAVGRGEATLGALRGSLFGPGAAETGGAPVRNLLWPEGLRRMVEEAGFAEATRGAASGAASGLAEFTIEAIRP